MDELAPVTGQGDATTDKEANKPVPATLIEYLRGEGPAGAYVTALLAPQSKTKIPTEADREEAVAAVAASPALLSRAVDLAKAAFGRTDASRIKPSVIALASDIIRAQDEDLAGWSRLAGSTAEAELGKLAVRVRGARASSDKEALQRAEQVFQLGLAVVCTRADFDTIGAIAEVYGQLSRARSGSKVSSPETIAKKAISRASVKGIETFGAINAAVSTQLKEVQRQFAIATEQIAQNTERARVQRDQIDEQRRKIEVLEAEKQQLLAELGDARSRIGGLMGGHDHQLNELRARFRKLLAGNLTDFVSQAHEALISTPPAPDIAEALLEDARTDIDKELQWLKQFLG